MIRYLFRRVCLTTCLVMGLMAPSAHAAVDLSLFGVLENATSTTGSSSSSGSIQVGGGLGVSLGHFELDGIYLPRNATDQLTYIEIPLMYRFWLGKYITLAAGGFYDVMISNVTLADGSVAAASDAGYASNNYGLVGVAGLNLPLGKMSFFAEARYNYGLSNASSVSGISTRLSDIQILAGFRFGGIGGK